MFLSFESEKISMLLKRVGLSFEFVWIRRAMLNSAKALLCIYLQKSTIAQGSMKFMPHARFASIIFT